MTIVLKKTDDTKARAAFEDLMKILYRLNKHTYYRAYSQDEFVLVEIAVFDGGLSLGLIKTPDGMRRKGLGTRAMKEICEIADRHQVKITGSVTPTLSPHERKAMSKAQLHKWYAKFGFEREPYTHVDKLSDNIFRKPR
jgi:hypothetical protein